MPNGGTHNCGDCKNFEATGEWDGECRLRNVHIASVRYTTCANFFTQDSEVAGPLYAIICEVRDRAGTYTEIPYFDGCRADTVQLEDGGDTVVHFTDAQGQVHQFDSSTEYLEFYDMAKKQE